MKDPNVHSPEAGPFLPERSWVSRTATSLLRRVRDNDPGGWQRLADLYGPWVYAIGRRKGLAPEDAADITQETFRAIHRSMGRYDHDSPGASFRGWLKRITVNKIRDHWRHCEGKATGVGGSAAYRLLQQLPSPAEDLEVTDDEADARLERDEVEWLYGRALELVRGEFSPSTWQAFWETTVAEREPAEVAAALKMTRNAVYVAKSRVLSRLRAELSEAIAVDETVGDAPGRSAL
jgi:RNA polymerase sigma-70 factor (ECF subfamily)